MLTVRTAVHVAHLDPMTGFGLLVRPALADDLPSPVLGPSLHEADWNGMVRRLAALGWQPAEDDDIDDVPRVVGYTPDRREVVGLVADEPVVDDPTEDQLAEVDAALRQAAGLS